MQQPRHQHGISRQSPRSAGLGAQAGRSILTTAMVHSNAPEALQMRREMHLAMLQAERERLATHKMVTAAIEQGRKAAVEEATALAMAALDEKNVKRMAVQEQPEPDVQARPRGCWEVQESLPITHSVARALEEAVAERDQTIAALQSEPRRLQQIVSERDREIAALKSTRLTADQAVTNAVAERERNMALLKKQNATLSTQLEAAAAELKLVRVQLSEQAEAHVKSLQATRKLETAAAELNAASEHRDAANDKLLADVRSRTEASTASLTAALAEAREQASNFQSEANANALKLSEAQHQLESMRQAAVSREASMTKVLGEAQASQQQNAQLQEEQLAAALRGAKQLESAAIEVQHQHDALHETVVELQVAKLKAQHAADAQQLEAVRLEANQATAVMALQSESAAREAASAEREAAQVKTISSMQAEIHALKLSLKAASDSVKDSNVERDFALAKMQASTPQEPPPPAEPAIAPQPVIAPPAVAPPAMAPLAVAPPVVAPPPTAFPVPASPPLPAAPFPAAPPPAPYMPSPALGRSVTAPLLTRQGTGETVGSVFRRHHDESTELLNVNMVRNALADLGVSLKHPTAVDAVATLERSNHPGLNIADFRRLRKALLSVPPPAPVPPTIGTIWRTLSSDPGGIDSSRLPEALSTLGLSAEGPVAVALIARHAMDPNAQLSLNEFRLLCKEVKACWQHLGTGETVGQVFKRLDVSSSGAVPLQDVSVALNDLGYPTASTLNAAAMRCLTDAGVTMLALDAFRTFIKSIKKGCPVVPPSAVPVSELAMEQSAAGLTPIPEAGEASSAPPGLTAQARNWYYLDSQDVMQGPFEEVEVLEWVLAGELPLELLMCPAAGDLAPGRIEFRPLSDHLANGGLLAGSLGV